LLFLFSGSVYGDEPEVKKEFWRNEKLRSKTYYKFGIVERLETWFYSTGEKLEEVPWKNGKKEGLVTN
jgi:antitoxin component YwqK of YwqJK toxin-antitoxin module